MFQNIGFPLGFADIFFSQNSVILWFCAYYDEKRYF